MTLTEALEWAYISAHMTNADGRAITTLAAEVRRIKPKLNEHAALLAFARDILRESRGCLGIGDVDGWFIQTAGLKHGLLSTKTVVAPCCENCPCADAGEFPVQCHFETELVKSKP